MADTPQQIQYDADFAAFNAEMAAADPVSRPRIKAKFDTKYPEGRPGGDKPGRDMSGFNSKIGFVLTKALTEDPVTSISIL